MAYAIHPHGSHLSASNSNSGDLVLSMSPQAEHITPREVDEWLREIGWICNGVDPNNGAILYTKESITTNARYFAWYEAVAYETFRFLTLGG